MMKFFRSRMARFILWAAVVAVGFGLCGCTDRATVRSLEAADGLVESRPDSALAILEEIDRASLRSDRYRALYGLLYTQARDKNFLFQDSDSLISFAADYYRTSSDRARYAAALHYKSTALQRASQNTQALAGFLEVIDIAEQLGDDFRISLAARGVSQISLDGYNLDDELRYARMAYDHILRTGRQPYINYALRDLIDGYCNTRDTAAVARLIPQLLDSAVKYEDPELIRETFRIKGYSALWFKDTRTVIENISILCDNGVGFKHDSLCLAYAYALDGDSESAMRYLRPGEGDERYYYYIVLYEIYKHEHDFENAFRFLEKSNDISGRMFDNHVNLDLFTSAGTYHEQSRQQLKNELKVTRLTIVIWSIASAAVILIIVLLARHNRQRVKQRLNESLLLAELLQDELDANDSQLSISSVMMRKFLAPRHSLLDTLCTAVYENSNSSTDSTRNAVEKIKSIINGFFTDRGTLKSFEHYVDSNNDNIFSDFKRDMPDLKEADYNLFLFSVLRFSNVSISVLIKDGTVEKVYSRKRHLKDRIKELGGDKASRYLAAL